MTTINLDDINLKLQDVHTCGDFVLYYVTGKKLGFEAQFDDGTFNGEIFFCENIGDDEEEEWKPVTDQNIYDFIKQNALKDYNQ